MGNEPLIRPYEKIVNGRWVVVTEVEVPHFTGHVESTDATGKPIMITDTVELIKQIDES